MTHPTDAIRALPDLTAPEHVERWLYAFKALLEHPLLGDGLVASIANLHPTFAGMSYEQFTTLPRTLAAKLRFAEAELARVKKQRDLIAGDKIDLVSELRQVKAERDAALEVLQKIESRPDKMIWGEDYEVSGAMRDMEDTARAFLADRQKGGEG